MEEEALRRRLKGKGFLKTAIAVLDAEKDKRAAQLNAAVTAAPDTIPPEVEDALAARVIEVRARADDLRANGRDPYQRPFKSYVRRAIIDNYGQKTGNKLIHVAWPAGYEDKLDEELAAVETPEAHPLWQKVGFRSRADLEDEILNRHGTPSAETLRAEMRQAGIPAPRVVETPERRQVKNTARIVPAGTQRRQGYPDDAGRKTLRSDINALLDEHSADWHAEEAVRAAARVTEARAAAAGTAWQAARRLNLLRHPGLKWGALAGGALVGALAGWSVVDHIHRKLTKADEAPQPPDDALALARHGTEAEREIAERLARVLGSVKDDAAGDLLSPRRGSLMENVSTGLDHALRPMDTASRAGIETPIPVEILDTAGNSRIVNLTLSARSPRVEEFVRTYRTNRITALAADQAATIKDILIETARTGMSPQEMANRVRQTIGLTPYQAASVMNYKGELETLNPAAIARKLRDGRFDKTLRRAIDENRPLSADQVQAMTDAYHRKFLAHRAMTIARTEGVGAANNGHIAAVEDLLEKNPGYSVIKTWIATEDERTRADHIGLHGKSVVGLHTPFICDSGDMIRWPHDQGAVARQVVNCRCTLACRLVSRRLAARRGPVGSLQPETT